MLGECLRENTTEYSAPCVMLLGGFDGLHIGHQKLIDCAKKYNLPVGIMTIEGGKGESLFSFSERREIFARQGISFAYSLAFTEEMKNTTREDFLSSLVERFNVQAFVCGKDFRFGKGAAGTPAFIGEFTGIPVHAVDIFNVDGQKVSASSIKEYLHRGETERANGLLLQPFFLKGKVEEGRRMGRTLGFPTANVAYPPHKFPLKEGVYAVHAELDGTVYCGIANFGACPTFGVTEKKAEAYFEGYEGDLYGKEIEICFDKYLRDIQKFESKDALSAQLRKDIQRVKEFLL